MSPNFEIVNSGLYDNVTVDARGRPVVFKPFTLPIAGQPFEPMPYFAVVSDISGTFPVRVELQSPDAPVQGRDLPPVTMHAGVPKHFYWRMPISGSPKGQYTMALYILDTLIGGLTLEF